MHHHVIDALAHRPGFLMRRDARVKLGLTIALVIAMVTTELEQWLQLVGLAVVIACVVVLARPPLGYAARRSLLVLPFLMGTALFSPVTTGETVVATWAGVEVTREGLLMGVNVLVKGYLSFWALFALAASTPFNSVVAALRWFRVPRVLVMVLAMMYRYLGMIIDQGQHMVLARDIRAFGNRKRARLATPGMIATLFARSLDRAERVYQAMLVRGYTGEYRPRHGYRLTWGDLGLVVLMGGATALFAGPWLSGLGVLFTGEAA